MTDGQAFDIASLHIAYRNGWTAIQMIDTVLARIDAVDDPASSCIWPTGRV